MKSEFFNPNSKPSYALMSTISGHDDFTAAIGLSLDKIFEDRSDILLSELKLA